MTKPHGLSGWPPVWLFQKAVRRAVTCRWGSQASSCDRRPRKRSSQGPAEKGCQKIHPRGAVIALFLLGLGLLAKLRVCSPQVHAYRLAEFVGERIDAGGYPALLSEREGPLSPSRREAYAAREAELFAWQTEMGFGVGSPARNAQGT